MARSSDNPGSSTPARLPRRRASEELTEYQAAVAGYTAAGADETVQRVVTALARITKRLDTFYRSQLAALDLQRGDWGVLQALALSPDGGCSTPSQLADATGVSPSTMTHRLDLLANRGLVERTADPLNRTRSKVRLTRSGRDLFNRAIQDADVAESEVLSALDPDERRRLADVLERLLAGIPG
ncbi:MarR family transcriptional regulator [Jatrophihabitans telluris]|uniref:MarR family transcriptional regulator n=1 Tax=Jatrophihabitans telluris TaxID=2038343 RepID=A0ABY4R2Q5_9ACTN|nr:MarR family transcriptional regulator [Jatrophihabitans telluris]UQX89541.1 MarR family transcriptional regulator [Jatrophihabitans telluris]